MSFFILLSIEHWKAEVRFMGSLAIIMNAIFGTGEKTWRYILKSEVYKSVKDIRQAISPLCVI